MTAPLTPERLAEIRGRLEAASPGPWRCWNGFPLVGETAQRLGMHGINRIGPDSYSPDEPGGLLGGWSEAGDLYATAADAEFVATAPTAIAELLAEVDFLRALAVEQDHAVRSGTRTLNDAFDALRVARGSGWPTPNPSSQSLLTATRRSHDVAR